MGSAPRLGEGSAPSFGDTRVHPCIVCDHALRHWDALHSNRDEVVQWLTEKGATPIFLRTLRALALTHWTGFGQPDKLAAHLDIPFADDRRFLVLEAWKRSRRGRLKAGTKRLPREDEKGKRLAYYLERAELDGVEIDSELLMALGQEVYGADPPPFVGVCARMMKLAANQKHEGTAKAASSILRGMGIPTPNPRQEAARQRSLDEDERRDRW